MSGDICGKIGREPRIITQKFTSGGNIVRENVCERERGQSLCG